MMIRLFVLATFALSALNLIPLKHFLLEINRNLGAYYLASHLAGIVLVTIGWWSVGAKFARYACLVAIVLSYPYVRSVVPFYLTPEEITGVVLGEKVSILLVDGDLKDGDVSKLTDLVKEIKPNVIGVTSFHPGDEAILKNLGVGSVYPHFREVGREGSLGLLLASKFPFVGGVITDVGEGLPPVISVALQMWKDESPVALTFLQSPAPVDSKSFREAQLLLRRLGVGMRHTAGTGIVFGAFNATPFSDQYGRIPVAAEFSNVFHGRGLYRTWNAHNFFLRFPIDHIFYRGNLQVVDAEVLGDIGSEHLPVLASFVPYG